MSDRITARYWLETPLPLEQAAATLAGEQSTGTFVKVPGETPELTANHAARVEAIEALDTVAEPSLPGGQRPADGQYRRAHVTLSWPLANVGVNLPTLLSTVAGNLFELRDHSGLKLLDLELPEAYAACPGPQFGIAGTRRLAGVHDRPLIGTIIKPSVGLSPAATAELVAQLAAAEIDFIKDDELMADPPHSPFADRVAAVMRVIRKSEDKLGRTVMYAFNISADLDSMKRYHDLVLEAGGTCVMVSLNSVGLTGVEALRRHSQLPIHGHRNGWGMYTRHPALGITWPVYQQLWRLAGADHLHVNGIANKFWEPDDSVVASIEAVLRPLFRDGDAAMPVISSGQWGGQAPETWRRTQTVEVIYLAGGGVMAHPDGPGAGVRGLREAWEAAVAGIELAEYAQTHPTLAGTLAKFGGRA